MPYAPQHPCPGCGTLLPRGYSRCRACKVELYRRQDTKRGTVAQRGYGAAHRVWAQAILSRQPWCAHCQIRPSTVADHVIPKSKGGAAFDLSNGQGLCTACHNAKTRRGA